MPLPSFVTKIKIHPAIGFARLSTNPDAPYIFGEPAHPQNSYKSGGLIKRQAVRFRLFGFNDNGSQSQELSLGDLSENGVQIIWQCSVANRKTFDLTGEQDDIMSSTARSDQNNGLLFGTLRKFDEGRGSIPLGQIQPDGVFIPPISRIVRRTSGAPLPTSGMEFQDFSDNTSDGWVTVLVKDAASGATIDVEVLLAWVVVAPPDFAPETDGHYQANSYGKNLAHYFFTTLRFQENSQPANATARSLDRDHLRRGAGHFLPGIEIDKPRRRMFYPADSVMDEGEARVLPSPRVVDRLNPGQAPGQMTSGLCSPWQGDFKACGCSHWVAHRPDFVILDEGNGAQGKWLRRVATEAGDPQANRKLNSIQDFVDHVDKLGIIRGDNSNDPSQGPEHERGPGDDIPN